MLVMYPPQTGVNDNAIRHVGDVSTSSDMLVIRHVGDVSTSDWCQRQCHCDSVFLSA